MAKGILIVEDDHDVRETMGMLMECEGYEVYSASNGKEALEILKNGSRPSVILTDIMMPVMTGWEFLEIVAANPIWSSIPVIILSAAEKKSSSNHGKVVAFLPKPTDVTMLIDLINKHG